ncbi:SGNH/GDSL hydrolase family protein [bacterium]|nr:SGNH/GDSL hydrolase family protein [bacterium]
MDASPIQTEPAEIVEVKGEEGVLPDVAPKGWACGRRLDRLGHAAGGLGPGVRAFDPGSVVVRHADCLLEEGKDYLLDHEWGTMGLAPGSTVTNEDRVEIDYRYSLLRLDSLVLTGGGQRVVRRGQSDLTVPEPPALGEGERREANILVPYFSDGGDVDVYPILETPAQAQTLTTPGRIPNTMAKIWAGRPVKIVCWGDSVTEGGDASSPGKKYVSVFAEMLREKFPECDFTVKPVCLGGSNSDQWLHPEKSERLRDDASLHWVGWQAVADEKPDLITLEFVNDAGLEPRTYEEHYADIVRRTRELGAELVLITPHFTRPSMMGFESLRDEEKRAYVLFLRKFSEGRRLALADASSRWGHLWKEGIPYMTLLRNGINHPEDRGHALFAEELIRCFG